MSCAANAYRSGQFDAGSSANYPASSEGRDHISNLFATVFGELPASPRLGRTAGVRSIRASGQFVCFLAGRFNLTQPSWPKLIRPRKWMSDPADASIHIWSILEIGHLVSLIAVDSISSHLKRFTAMERGDLRLPLDKPLSSWKKQLHGLQALISTNLQSNFRI